MAQVWLNTDGRITRVQIVDGSGSTLLDSAITSVLDAVSVGEAPPQGMPQPVDLRIGAR